MSAEHENFRINDSTYHWSVRLFSTFERLLKVNIRLHGDCQLLDDGQIFVFNHFSRFETFIPQYLIHRHTGSKCRSVAHGEFFRDDSLLANYLRAVGAVPHDLDGVLVLLAREVLHGRKVVLFPEGGMVKDRRVIDAEGQYRVFSPSAGERRTGHTGAAVLANTLEAIRGGLLECHRRGDRARLEAWRDELAFDTVDELLEALQQSILIVPANITFYPIRVKDNLLLRGAQLFSRGLNRRTVEELLIEGNILTRDTDMDIRLDEPIRVAEWHWHERQLIHRRLRHESDLERWFDPAPKPVEARLLARCLRGRIQATRDAYMHGVYAGTTVNLSHLASGLIVGCIERGEMAIEQRRFRRILYLAIKACQVHGSLKLHRSLLEPDRYADVLDSGCEGLRQFLEMATRLELLEVDSTHYRFLPKLCVEHEFETIRMENLVSVYANEVAPLLPVSEALQHAMATVDSLTGVELAGHLFDDELRAYQRDRRRFMTPRHAEVNSRETATADPTPFLLNPRAASFGVLVVHGFLASPAEVSGFAELIAARDVPVAGIRLSGHGTSPWDLRERGWRDWLASLQRGYRLLAEFCDRVVIVGFSTGGALALLHAAEQPARLTGVVSIAAPLRFRSPGMRFVPLMHGANQLARWLSIQDDLKPFHVHVSEHPDINYRQMPIRGLYELSQMAETLAARLATVRCPLLLLQATDDPVVEPSSAEQIYNRAGSRVKRLCWIDSDRHGILNEAIGGTHQVIVEFLEQLRVDAPFEGIEKAPERPDNDLGSLEVEVVTTG